MVTMIAPKIDYYTAIWHNSSLRDVLEFLDLDGECANFLNDTYEAIRGLDINFIFRYNDVELSVHAVHLYNYIDDPNDIDICIADKIFPRIRLNLSGSALDYLRTRNFDIEKLRDNCPGELLSYHVTRCDIAFDFVNYNDCFMDDLINYLHNHLMTSDQRVRFISPSGRNYALKCTVKIGGQRTAYLGSTQADRLLRIYDKQMEWENSGKSFDDLPFVLDEDGLSSWFRIELQLRNKEAQEFLFARTLEEGKYYEGVLRWIYENYMFRRMDIDRRKVAEPCEFWESLWEWDIIPNLITQNANSVFYVSVSDSLFSRLERSKIFLLQVVDFLGVEGLLSFINSSLTDLQVSSDIKSDELKRILRLRGFVQRKHEYESDERCGNYIRRGKDGLFHIFDDIDDINDKC